MEYMEAEAQKGVSNLKEWGCFRTNCVLHLCSLRGKASELVRWPTHTFTYKNLFFLIHNPVFIC